MISRTKRRVFREELVLKLIKTLGTNGGSIKLPYNVVNILRQTLTYMNWDDLRKIIDYISCVRSQ